MMLLHKRVRHMCDKRVCLQIVVQPNQELEKYEWKYVNITTELDELLIVPYWVENCSLFDKIKRLQCIVTVHVGLMYVLHV